MENQDFNKELIDYLYGEMTAGERLAFERKMDGDAGLRREFEELKAVKTKLSELEDKEVMEPFSVWGKTRGKNNSGKRVLLLKPIIAVAASLLLLMFAGYLLDFSASISSQGIQFGYNQGPIENEKVLGEHEIKSIVAGIISQNNQGLLSEINERDSMFQNQISNLEKSVSNQLAANKTNTIDDKDLQNFLVQLEKRNAELVSGYLKLTSAQQQEYFKTMLTQFNDFVQEQRNEDLAAIQNNLIELKQTQSIQKQETDQVLASLITNINYKSKN